MKFSKALPALSAFYFSDFAVLITKYSIPSITVIKTSIISLAILVMALIASPIAYFT